MTEDDIIRYNVSGHVAGIGLNRPPVNAMSFSLLEQLIVALKRAAADENERAVLITSAVPSRFSAGLDLDMLLRDSKHLERSN